MEYARATAVWLRLTVVAGAVVAMLHLMVAGSAFGHGAAVSDFRAVLARVEPTTVPVDIRVTGGDTLRVENAGSSTLELCEASVGESCRAYVRIDDAGVYVRPQSKLLKVAELPSQAKPEDGWLLVRREPKFFAYHDPRMSVDIRDVVDEIDQSDTSAQPVGTIDVPFRYGEVEGVVKLRLEYVGGQTWTARYGEQALTALAIVAMLAFFMFDRRQRRLASTSGVDA